MEQGTIIKDINSRYWIILSDKYMMDDRDVVKYYIDRNQCIASYVSIGRIEDIDTICKWDLIELRKEFLKKLKSIREISNLQLKRDELLKEIESIDKQISELQ